jgi:hypothetical protein
VVIYVGRTQIEQTFRDVKNPRWGLGLFENQTRKPGRSATLLLIGALACYALWLIGLALRSSAYRIEFGSREKAPKALSVISPARWWIAENPTTRSLEHTSMQGWLRFVRWHSPPTFGGKAQSLTPYVRICGKWRAKIASTP